MVGTSIQIISTILVSLIVSFIFEWKLALIYLGFFPVIVISTICMYRVQREIKISSHRIDKESGNLLTDTLLNTKTIYAFNMQNKMIDKYSQIIGSQNRLILKTSILNGVFFGIVLLIMFFAFGVLLYCVADFIRKGTSMGNALRSVFPLLFALFGLTLTQQYVGDMSNAKEALARIFKILDEPSTIDPINTEDKSQNQIQEGKIEFRNVSFAYPERPNQLVLKNVNFTLNKGESLGLIGFSGSGKSTIIQLIERFYDPTSGSILVDDIDIRNYNLIAYRKSLGLLMEEPNLFKKSVIENIKYGKLDADVNEIEDAANKANIKKFLNVDLLNSNSPVSGGEKQRICLARVMIRNPKMLLLDEPTAALDKNSEDFVQKSIDDYKKSRTTIEIAHKLSTIENCDKIIMIENGEIVEQGKHKELLDLRGKYFSLYNAGRLSEK